VALLLFAASGTGSGSSLTPHGQRLGAYTAVGEQRIVSCHALGADDLKLRLLFLVMGVRLEMKAVTESTD